MHFVSSAQQLGSLQTPASRLPRQSWEHLEHAANLVNRSRIKRGLDLLISLLLITFLAPGLMIIAVAIKFSTGGPVLFWQWRTGLNGKPFRICKFTTMHVKEGAGEFTQAARDDQRVTRVGAYLRKTSFDELPQLFNVVAGSMSLVGPRPHALPMDRYYSAIIPEYGARHLVRPGLTGLAQVSGFRGPTTEMKAMSGRLKEDLNYIRKWNLALDLKIMLRTPMVLLGPDVF